MNNRLSQIPNGGRCSVKFDKTSGSDVFCAFALKG